MIRTRNRVALYARFSSDNQRSESIDAQIRAMQFYCKQHNYFIVETYIDEAKSATTDRRPSFQRMIADSKNKAFDILLVHKLDRFARNRYDSAVYKRELKKNGVQVFSVLENLDDSPESIMMEAVLEGMAEYYSQNLGREVMKGLKENALSCIHTGGKPPLGYDIDEVTKRLVINEEEAETVRIIFDLCSKGYGYSYILDALNREGRLTKKGVAFGKNSLHSILTNPKYQGLYVYNRSSAKSIYGTRNTHLLKENEEIITIDGGCPQIVDPVTYDKVQRKMNERKHKGGRGNAKTTYLLSGKLVCKNCGRALTGSTAHEGRAKALRVTYRCPTKQCDTKNINRDYLEAYVLRLLEQEIFSATALNRLAKKIARLHNSNMEILESSREEIDEKLAEIDEALTNVANFVASGLVSDTLKVKLRSLEEEKAKLLSQIGIIDGTTDKNAPIIDSQLICSTYRRLKETPASPEYKDFIQGFIDKIEVGRYAVDITLKTGLDIFSDLDTTYHVKRQEIYKTKKMA